VGKRLTRKEIKKKDPITEALQKFWALCLENRRYLVIGLSVILGAIIVVMLGTLWYNRSQSSRATALQEAREIYNARVDTTLKAPQDGAYPSETAKYEAALKAFQSVEQNYGSAQEGLLATYYKGVCQRELGRAADAEKTFRAVLQDADDPFMAQVVKLALAETLRVQRKYDEALPLLNELSQATNPAVTSESVAYTKALCLEEKGSFKEAYDVLKAAKAALDEKGKSGDYVSPYESVISSRIDFLKARLGDARPANS